MFRRNQIKSENLLVHGLTDLNKANTKSMGKIVYEPQIPGSSHVINLSMFYRHNYLHYRFCGG